MTFNCPKVESCNFTTQILSQMNNHLRKHTKTYKCGHCGKTYLDNSDFHRHSAMSLEDKILEKLSQNKSSNDETLTEREPAPIKSRLVARKSTDPESRSKSGDVCRNVARKS